MQRLVSKLVAMTVITIASSRAHEQIPEEMTLLTNKDVRPCDDFYAYACGNWIKTNPLDGRTVKLESSFKMIDDQNKLLFKKILDEKHPLVDELWESCRNEIDTSNPLLVLMKNSFPFRDDIERIVTATTREKILKMAGEYFRTGTQAFTTLTIEPDSSDAKISTIYLSPAALPGIDYIYDTFQEHVNDYREYIDRLFRDAQVDVTRITKTHVPKGSHFVVHFERELSMIKQRHNGPTRRMSITDAMEKWPNMVGEFFKGVGILQKTTVNKEFKIFIEKSSYFDAMEKFLKSTSIRDLQVYMMFVMIHSRIQWLDSRFYRSWFSFYGQKIDGQRLPLSRDSFCVSNLIQFMPDLFGKYYTSKAFSNERKKYALEMVKYIKEAMGKHIEKSSWLKENDQTEAKAKLNNILPLVGESPISQSYPRYIARSQYAYNVRSILSHSFDSKMKKVGQPVKREEWTESPATANAFYSLRENRLVLPTAILQPPLFNGKKVHPARNFGAIGTIIGHEMTHAFDIKGHMFDRHGNVRQWWSEATFKDFKAHADRMKLQYSAYDVHGDDGILGKVDGDLTLVENIADNGGLALAWDAYHKYMTTAKQENSRVTRQDGDKMFFLAFAQTWCTNTRDETLSKLLVTDDRAPGKWRVNGALMNNDDFAKTFECKPGDPMNPSRKVNIW